MDQAELRLVVDNLGPIGHADVALRPLTVLIGRNNTGKTYLAQALYAAHKSIDRVPLRLPENLTPDEHAALLEEFRPLFSSERSETYPQVKDLPLDLPSKMTEWVSRTLEETGLQLKQRLFAYFGVSDLSEIARWGGKDVVVKLVEDAGDSQLFGSSETVTVDLSDVLSTPFDEDPFEFPPYARLLAHNGDDEDIERHYQEFSWILAAKTWQGYVRQMGLGGSAHYLPAGRSGLLQAWTDVVKLRLQLERERYGLVRPDSDLGGVALDFISSLADVLGSRSRGYGPQLSLFHYPRPPKESDSLALLQELMGGKILAGSEDDMVPTLDYEQDGHRLAIRRASSMVADLAPLAMWIDRLIEPGDLLVIDEPESHLHPEAIRLVARVLVRLVNENVRVVCATHSSVLLHELSNCILRGQLTNTEQQSNDEYVEGDILAFEDIAVHRFHRPAPTDPVEVTRVKIEPDWGISEDEYVAVASELSDETARLIDLLA